jgi:hypothetical protein
LNHHPRRYMTATIFPSITRGTGVVDFGACCLSCSNYNHKWASLRNHRTYSKAGYLEHFKHCPDSQDIWEGYPEEMQKCEKQIQIIRSFQ